MVNWESAGPILFEVGQYIILGLIAVLVGGGGAFGVFLYRQKKKYSKYKIFIYRTYKNKDSGDEIPLFVGWDKAAIIKDKESKAWRFHVKKINYDLGMEETGNLDEMRDLDIPSMPSDDGKQIVFIKQLGPRKYSVGKPIYFEGNPKVIVSAADVAEAIRSFDINARLAGKDNKWWVGPTLLIICVAVIFILIAILINKFEVLLQVAESLEKVSKTMETAAGQLVSQSAVPSGAPT